MGSEWSTWTVEELISQGVLAVPLDGNHGAIHPKSSDFVSAGVPFIMASDLIGGRVDLNGCAHITSEQAGRLRKGFAKAGDVLLSHKATIGRTAILQASDNDFVVLTPQVTYYRVQDPERLNYRFLKYYFDASDFQQVLSTWAGAGSTRAYLGITAQRKLPILLPPIEDQETIASVLGALDDKIALLRETNATLEAIAQALFKSWFVDFDPVRAKEEGRDPEGVPPEVADLFPSEFEASELEAIPKGWKSCLLEEACEVNPTRRLQKGADAPYLEMSALPTSGHRPEAPISRAFSSGTKFMDGDSLLARITPCLENGKTAFVDFLSKEVVGWGSTEYIVLRPRAPLPPYWGYLLCRHEPFRQFAIQAMAGTSGRQRVDVSRLIHFRVALPSAPIARAFAEIVEPIQMRIAANDDQVKTLANYRDTLLPRLMSGKLCISEVTV